MTNNNMYLLSAILIMAVITLAIRGVPFLLFGGKKEMPKSVKYLGNILPTAMIATLVVYCLKSVTPMTGNHGLPELISVAVVAVLHIWRKNTFLSIGLGTICYMVLVQVVF